MGKNLVAISSKKLKSLTINPSIIPDKYFGFVYEWTNKINDRAYIGSHKGEIYDGYCGSGVFFLKAIKTHNINNFRRKILAFAYYEKELEKLENFYLKKFNVDKNQKYYNLKDSAVGGKQPDHIIKQTAEKLKGRKMPPNVNESLQKYRTLPKSEKWKKLMSLKMTGRKRSDEDKKKQSRTLKKLFKLGKLKISESHLKKMVKGSRKYYKNIPEKDRKKLSLRRLGKKMSDKTKKKISLIKKKGFLSGRYIIKPSTLAKMRKGAIKYYKNMPPEDRRKLSLAHLGKKLSEKTKRKISKAQKGKKLSSSTRIKMSKARKGVPLSDIHKNRLSEARKGMKFSAAHKKALSTAAKKRAWHTSLVHKGKKLSEKTKLKIALTKKRNKQKIKNSFSLRP